MSKKKVGRIQTQSQGGIQDEIQVFLNAHPNANIKDVLDQKEAIDLSGPCLKSFNKFVTRDNETFMSLIYLIDANESELSEEQLKRYPFIASECFKHDQIVDFLFNSDNCKEFLDNIFKILQADYLITTVAGYFAKVINQLVKKKGLNLWQYIVSCGVNVIEDLIKHLYDYNIAKAIQDLIILNTFILENQTTFFSERISFVNRIFNYMIEKKYNQSIVENVSDILIQVLHEINAYDEKSNILQILCKPESIHQLIFYTQSTQVVKFLNESFNSLIQYIDQTKQQSPLFTFNYFEFQLLGNNFHNLLKEDLQISSNYLPIQATFQTTYKEEQQQPFGQYRLQLIEFYYKVLRANDQLLLSFFNHKEIYTILLDFLDKHEFNNALQNLFVNITMFIFGSDLAEIQQAYYEANLFEYLKFLGINKTTQVGQIKKQITKGQMGVVNKLANFFRTYQEESWIQFLETHQQILDVENHYFFDFNPHEGEENEVEATCNIEQLQQNIIELIKPKIKLSVKEFGQITEATGQSQLIEVESSDKEINQEIQQQVQPNFDNLQIETQNQQIQQRHENQPKNALTDLTPQMQKGQKKNDNDQLSKSDQLYLPKNRIANQEEKQNHEEFVERLQKHIKIILQESVDLEKKLEKYYNQYQKKLEKLSQGSGTGSSRKLESSQLLFSSKIINQKSEIEEEEGDNFRRRVKSVSVRPQQKQF